MFGWIADLAPYWWVPLGLWVLSWGLIPAALLSRSAQPSGKVAWILAILGLPVLGGLLYLVFSAGPEERYSAAKRKAADELVDRLPDPDEEDPGDAPEALRTVWDLAGELAGHPAAGGNAVRAMPDAAAAIHRVIAAIDGAENSVSILFYTFRSDACGTAVRDALARAAGRGVAVRFMYDRFGSLGLTRSFLKPLTDAGGRAEPFQPRGNGLLDRLRLNLRNHRKIVVIDGAVGFTGGVNVGDEYLSKDPGTAPWRDTFAEVRGPAAGRLQRVFAQDWLFLTGEALTDRGLYHGSGDRPEPHGDDWLNGVTLRVLDDGPDRRDRAHECVYAAALHAARRRVDLSTGYFVPTTTIVRALQCAARRGVRVRVLHGGPGSPLATRLAARWQLRRPVRRGRRDLRADPRHAAREDADGRRPADGPRQPELRLPEFPTELRGVARLARRRARGGAGRSVRRRPVAGDANRPARLAGPAAPATAQRSGGEPVRPGAVKAAPFVARSAKRSFANPRRFAAGRNFASHYERVAVTPPP